MDAKGVKGIAGRIVKETDTAAEELRLMVCIIMFSREGSSMENNLQNRLWLLRRVKVGKISLN